MAYYFQIRKEFYFCLGYLKIHGLLFNCFVFHYIDSNQDLNMKQERTNTKKRNHLFSLGLLG